MFSRAALTARSLTELARPYGGRIPIRSITLDVSEHPFAELKAGAIKGIDRNLLRKGIDAEWSLSPTGELKGVMVVIARK